MIETLTTFQRSTCKIGLEEIILFATFIIDAFESLKAIIGYLYLLQVDRADVEDLKDARFICIMADGSTDISVKEQEAVYVR